MTLTYVPSRASPPHFSASSLGYPRPLHEVPLGRHLSLSRSATLSPVNNSRCLQFLFANTMPFFCSHPPARLFANRHAQAAAVL